MVHGGWSCPTGMYCVWATANMDFVSVVQIAAFNGWGSLLRVGNSLVFFVAKRTQRNDMVCTGGAGGFDAAERTGSITGMADPRTVE